MGESSALWGQNLGVGRGGRVSRILQEEKGLAGGQVGAVLPAGECCSSCRSPRGWDGGKNPSLAVGRVDSINSSGHFRGEADG